MLTDLLPRLTAAVQARLPLLDARHENALRLFNGYSEGIPGLSIDLYARTAVLFNHLEQPDALGPHLPDVLATLRAALPWLQCALLKTRRSDDMNARRGVLVFGNTPDRRIRENDVRYAVDLQMNQDAGFYLDTRHLRAWLKAQSAGKRVLNTFAYTGSLGVAALAGGAQHVLQIDLNRRFLNQAKESCLLNGLPVHKEDYRSVDFFSEVAHLKRSGDRFDLLIIDPPFFSSTGKGVVDLETGSARLINKVRPLADDGARIVAINNALFTSGAEYLRELDALCTDGYLTIDEWIPVPDDFIGYAKGFTPAYPADPAPFNHPTKIAVLAVRRKTAG